MLRRNLPGAIATAFPRSLRSGWLVTPTHCFAGTANEQPATQPIPPQDPHLNSHDGASGTHKKGSAHTLARLNAK